MATELTPRSEQLIQELLSERSYGSRAAVLEDALELLRERRELQRHIDEGIRQLQNGEYADYDEDSLRELFDRIKAEGRQKLAVTDERP